MCGSFCILVNFLCYSFLGKKVVYLRWYSHKICTGAIVFAGTTNIWLTILAVAASTFPDRIEEVIHGKMPKNLQRPPEYHRKASHWIGFYLPALIISLYGAQQFPLTTLEDWLGAVATINTYSCLALLFNILLWLTVGAILHIAEDFPCGKMSLRSPFKKDNLPRLFYTGSTAELGVDVLVTGVCLLYCLHWMSF